MIPILDLKQQYHDLKMPIDAAIAEVLESGVFIMGPQVKAFEAEIAQYIGVRHAVALNSGTDALHLALRALDIGPGDEVITSPFTFAATTEAIGIVGATPVFVDIDPLTFNLDPQLIESAITERTKAILPVHLYGGPCDMRAIKALALKNKLAIVEDCAQAIGARVDGVQVGTFSEVGCFSFFPTKNLGAYGDGGLATTNDDKLAARLRSLRAHGGPKKYYHEELGVNSRLDEIQAAILRKKLLHLDRWNAARRRVAARYNEAFSRNATIAAPGQIPNTEHVYHQYTIRVGERERIQSALQSRGVQTMVYYPVPLHKQGVHKNLRQANQRLEHSEAAAEQVLSVPMYPELSDRDQDIVIGALEEATKTPQVV